MNKLKKAIAIGTTVMTICWSIGIAGLLPANATTYIADGDLVKAAGSSAVYYVQGATKRVFPHFGVYHSWGYPTDYSTVKTVTASELAAYTDGNPMPFRDGSLFRGKSSGLSGYAANAVYYVEGSKIRPVQSSEIYQALFKDASWSKVTWVPDDLLNKFTYPLGTVVATSSTHPNGSLIQYAGSTQKYLIVDGTKRAISDAAFTANNYLAANVITVSTTEAYADGATITGVETGLLTPGWTATTGVTTALSVGLSSDNQSSTTLPKGSSNVALLKATLTAGTNGATVTGLTFKRSGVGATGDWSDLYLYEGTTLLTPTSRTLSTDTQTVEFSALNVVIAANSSKYVTLRGDLLCTGAACATTSATAADQHVFSLTSIETGATVTGLPVTGNLMTVGSQAIGTATVTDTVTPTAPAVGAQNAEIADFKITNGSSNNSITFDQVTMTFTGNTARSGITNFKLYQAGETNVLATASSIATNDTLTLTLTTPFVILKGQNRTFVLKADVAGRVGETLQFYVEEDNQVVITDTQYGVGAKVTNTFAGTQLTLKGGTITLADNGPTVGNIGKNQQDVVLTKASITANRAVEVRKLGVTLCVDEAAVLDNDAGLVGDLRIKDIDTGSTLMTGTINTVHIGRCAVAHNATGNANPTYYELTNTFNLSSGMVKHLGVTVDLSADTDGLLDNIKLNASLAMVNRDATYVEIRDTTTGDYVKIADVVPQAITGDDQTIQAASLTPTLASTPVSATYIKGATEVPTMGMTLSASEAANVNVRSIQARVYAETTGDVGTLVNPNLVISSVKLYQEGTTTPLGVKSVSWSSSYGTVTFDGLNVTIPKGTNQKFTFKADLTSSITEGYNYWVGVYNHDATDNITAYDTDGNGLAISVADGTDYSINTGLTPTVKITAGLGGTLTVAKDAGSPSGDIVVAGTSNVVMSKFKFTANSENITIDKLKVAIATSASSRSVTAVKMTYTGGTATGYLSGGYATFTGMNWLIAKDKSDVLTISADLNTIDGGATSGDDINLGLACNTATYCNATGASGTVLGDTTSDFASATTDNFTANTMYVRQTRPTVALATGSATGAFVPGWTDVGTWTVSADAADDVYVNTLKFTIESNDTDWTAALAATDFTLYDTGSLSVDILTDTGITATYSTSTLTVTADSADYRFIVPKGSSKSYLLKAHTSAGGVIGTALAAGVDAFLDAYINSDAVAGTTGNLVWYDKSVGGTAINGNLIKALPVYSNGRTYAR
ncbi:MAG: hypothetical protein PHG83_00835 [Patescibacteria group bacterium]|nr:hypothetical protein [Patescibacteria group bacterium]